MEANLSSRPLGEGTFCRSNRSFLNEKGHILVFMADAHGGSSVFRHQHSPLTEVFLKRRVRIALKTGEGPTRSPDLPPIAHAVRARIKSAPLCCLSICYFMISVLSFFSRQAPRNAITCAHPSYEINMQGGLSYRDVKPYIMQGLLKSFNSVSMCLDARQPECGQRAHCRAL